MRRIVIGVSGLAVALGASLGTGMAGSVAAAAAPVVGNSRSASATSVTHLPFSTGQSTVNAPDASDAVDCYGHSHVAWFRFRADVAVTLEADTVGSDYDTTLSAYSSAPNGMTQIACNDDATNRALYFVSEVTVDVAAHQPVYFMVASF